MDDGIRDTLSAEAAQPEQLAAGASKLVRSPPVPSARSGPKQARNAHGQLVTPELIRDVVLSQPKARQADMIEFLVDADLRQIRASNAIRVGSVAVVGGLVLGVVGVVGLLFADPSMAVIAACGTVCALSAFCVAYGLVAAREGALRAADINRTIALLRGGELPASQDHETELES